MMIRLPYASDNKGTDVQTLIGNVLCFVEENVIVDVGIYSIRVQEYFDYLNRTIYIYI